MIMRILKLTEGENKTVAISLSVVCDDPNRVLDVSEKLSRTAIGLSLDGFNVGLNFISVSVEDESEESSD